MDTQTDKLTLKSYNNDGLVRIRASTILTTQLTWKTFSDPGLIARRSYDSTAGEV